MRKRGREPQRTATGTRRNFGGLYVTLPLHYAYPRVEGRSARQKRAWHTHRRTHNEKNHVRLLSIFLRAGGITGGACGGRDGVAKAAQDARAYRPSHLKIAPALLRRNSRLCCRLAAPGRLAATGSSSGSSRRGKESSRQVSQSAAELTAKSSSMVVTAPIDHEARCSNKSNAGNGKWAAGACRRQRPTTYPRAESMLPARAGVDRWRGTHGDGGAAHTP